MEQPKQSKPQGKESIVTITIPSLNLQILKLRVIGDSSLIVNQWSEKAKQQIRKKQFKMPDQKRAAKSPADDYKASLYHLPGGKGYGFPTIGFKSAAVDACICIAGIKKTEARGAFHVLGELVQIHGTPNMREDLPRNANGMPDLRYRGEFKKWEATLTIRYNANMLSPEQIANLFNHAGFSIGVGEWRTAKDGQHGMFHVG